MPDWRCRPEASSPALLTGLSRLTEWHCLTDHPLTLFTVAEQLDCPEFSRRLADLAGRRGVTIACHGWSHRCWSAWPADPAGFSEMLAAAGDRLAEFAGDAWRPWFRAPGGYIAPWMAEPLAAAGFSLDSSVNPSPLLHRKSGRRKDGQMVADRRGSNGWHAVLGAMRDARVVERPWSTLRWPLGPALPACGPALTLPLLGPLARRHWRRSTTGRPASEAELLDEGEAVRALYWHVLDHSRLGWNPPLADSGAALTDEAAGTTTSVNGRMNG